MDGWIQYNHWQKVVKLELNTGTGEIAGQKNKMEKINLCSVKYTVESVNDMS